MEVLQSLLLYDDRVLLAQFVNGERGIHMYNCPLFLHAHSRQLSVLQVNANLSPFEPTILFGRQYQKHIQLIMSTGHNPNPTYIYKYIYIHTFNLASFSKHLASACSIKIYKLNIIIPVS